MTTGTLNGVGNKRRRVDISDPKHEPDQVKKPIVVPALVIKTIDIRLVGTSPLICHAWSEKAIQMMLDKQTKQAKQGREAKCPEADVIDSLYWISGKPPAGTKTLDCLAKGRFGMPALCFKHAAVRGLKATGDLPMSDGWSSFHVIGQHKAAGKFGPVDVVEIEGRPQMHGAMVRIAMGTSDIRFRGEFPVWACTLRIKYNERIISSEQLVNAFQAAGFGVGIGEHRPQCGGQNGCFEVQ